MAVRLQSDEFISPGYLYLLTTRGLLSGCQLVEPGQTAVLDRGYQAHHFFDQWQGGKRHFVCRIKEATRNEVFEEYPLVANSHVFFDAKVRLGTSGVNQTTEPVRLVGYRIANNSYWIATDRFDLTAEQVALVYKLRWNIETFFAWWKQHLKVYHLFARSTNGLMVQILSGLITYLLLAIDCHEEDGEPMYPLAVCVNYATRFAMKPCCLGSQACGTKTTNKQKNPQVNEEITCKSLTGHCWGQVRPVHVASYIERLQEKIAAPSVKLQFAALRMLFNWLVVS